MVAKEWYVVCWLVLAVQGEEELRILVKVNLILGFGEEVLIFP